MKITFSCLITLLVALCLTLASCQVGDGGDGGDSGSGSGSGNSSGDSGSSDSGSSGGSSGDSGSADSGNSGSDTAAGDYIFKPGSTLNIVCASSGDAVKALEKELGELGITANIVGTTTAPADHEIIIGQTSREGSLAAYRRLSRIELSDDLHVGYVIYSTGNSLAVAYHEDKFDLEAAKNTAIEYIRDNLLVSSTLAPGKGTVCSVETSPIDYQASLDEIAYAEKQ
jgi:hypothetical protein